MKLGSRISFFSQKKWDVGSRMEGGSRINALVDMGYDTFYPWAPGYERVFFVRLTFLLEQLSQQPAVVIESKHMQLVPKTSFRRLN